MNGLLWLIKSNSIILILSITVNHRVRSREQQQQTISVGPENVNALRRTDVVLKCKVANQKGPVMWTKDGFALGDDRNLPAWSRYRMIGSSTNGEYNLEIKDVQLGDDATYQCQVGKTAVEAGHKSKLAKLTVLVPPTAPSIEGLAGHIERKQSITAKVGQGFNVVCAVNGGKPAPTLTWVVAKEPNGTKVIRKIREKFVSNNVSTKDSKLFNVRSDLRYSPKRADNGRYLVCLVSHEAVSGKLTTSAVLNIQYPPAVKVTLMNKSAGVSIIDDKGRLKESRAVTLTCETDAKPSGQIRYAWKLNGNVIVGEHGSTYRIPKLKWSHHEAVVECEARNSVGSGRGKYRLNLRYGPRMPPPDVIAVDQDENVVLPCIVDSNPSAKIRWYKEGKELAMGVNYTMKEIKKWNGGKYKCVAEVPGFSKGSATFSVHINGPPQILMVPTIESTIGAKKKDVICEIRGFPHPSDIIWFRNGRLLDAKDEKSYKMKNHGQAEGMVSILSISDVRKEDFGVFNCTAINRYGSDSASSKLVVTNPFPLYIMIPCLIGGAVFVITLTFCLILCRRRQLCSSKSSYRGDEQSDVTVKVEALDGNGLPLPSYYTAATAAAASAAENNSDIYSPPTHPHHHQIEQQQPSSIITGNNAQQYHEATAMPPNPTTIYGKPTQSADRPNSITEHAENVEEARNHAEDLKGGRENSDEDYLPIPQDNPDLDLMPPAYSSVGSQIYQYGVGNLYQRSTPASFQPILSGTDMGTGGLGSSAGGGSNGHLVQMTYLDDRLNGMVLSTQPVIYTDEYGNIIAAEHQQGGGFQHQQGAGDMYNNPYGGSHSYGTNTGGYVLDPNNTVYYPSTSQNNGVPSANTLETVQELPTPEHEHQQYHLVINTTKNSNNIIGQDSTDNGPNPNSTILSGIGGSNDSSSSSTSTATTGCEGSTIALIQNGRNQNSPKAAAVSNDYDAEYHQNRRPSQQQQQQPSFSSTSMYALSHSNAHPSCTPTTMLKNHDALSSGGEPFGGHFNRGSTSSPNGNSSGGMYTSAQEEHQQYRITTNGGGSSTIRHSSSYSSSAFPPPTLASQNDVSVGRYYSSSAENNSRPQPNLPAATIMLSSTNV